MWWLRTVWKTEAIPISFMTWKSKTSKRIILTTFGVEASAYRDALDKPFFTTPGNHVPSISLVVQKATANHSMMKRALRCMSAFLVRCSAKTRSKLTQARPYRRVQRRRRPFLDQETFRTVRRVRSVSMMKHAQRRFQ